MAVTGSGDVATLSGVGEAIDSTTGAVLTSVNGTYSTSSAKYSGEVSDTDYNVETLRPDQIAYGANALPGGGTLSVDSSTNVVTADVTGSDGTKYIITGTPNSTTGGFTLTIQASNGEEWTQTINPPAGSETDSKHRDIVFDCQLISDANAYFDGIAGIAGGVAVFAAVVGAEPVAVVASLVGGASEIIGGAAGLMKFFGRCS